MGPKDPVTDLDSVEEGKPLQRRTLVVVTEEWMAPGRSLKQFPKREQIRTFGYMATRWLCVPLHCSSTVKFTHSRKGNHSRNTDSKEKLVSPKFPAKERAPGSELLRRQNCTGAAWGCHLIDG